MSFNWRSTIDIENMHENKASSYIYISQAPQQYLNRVIRKVCFDVLKVQRKYGGQVKLWFFCNQNNLLQYFRNLEIDMNTTRSLRINIHYSNIMIMHTAVFIHHFQPQWIHRFVVWLSQASFTAVCVTRLTRDDVKWRTEPPDHPPWGTQHLVMLEMLPSPRHIHNIKSDGQGGIAAIWCQWKELKSHWVSEKCQK